MNTTYYLIRHGEVDNPKQIIYGRTAISLTEFGKRQIRKLAQYLQQSGVRPDLIVSSPLKRTLQSTEQIKAVFPYVPVRFEDDLQETDCGELTGLPTSFLVQFHDPYLSRECINRGFETGESVIKRMKSVVTKLTAAESGKTIFLISHGDPLAFLFWNLVYPEQKNVPMVEIEKKQYLKKGETWKLVVNDDLVVQEHEHIINS